MKKKYILTFFTMLTTSSFLLTKVMEITNNNFNQQVINNTKPVILDVYANWCNPCQKMKPIFEGLSNDFENQVVFAKMEYDQAPQIAKELGIDMLPTFIIYYQGKVIKKIVGSQTKEDLKKLITNLLQNI